MFRDIKEYVKCPDNSGTLSWPISPAYVTISNNLQMFTQHNNDHTVKECEIEKQMANSEINAKDPSHTVFWREFSIV